MPRAILLLGSNIQPRQNMQRALDRLCADHATLRVSRWWRTRSVGFDGPDFLNTAVEIETTLSPAEIKVRLIQPIEDALGRVRQADKNAPRTIDIDLIVYDEDVLDPALWKRLHVALPVSELLPDLRHPQSGEPLNQVAAQLQEEGWARVEDL